MGASDVGIKRMECFSTIRKLHDYLDRTLPITEQREMGVHLDECRECGDAYREQARLRRIMLRIPVRKPPQDLTTNLRVIASRERVRREQRINWRAMIDNWTWRFKLCLDNIMRPFALPVAGGVVSTVMLFSVFMPNLAQPRVIHVTNDVPTMLTTEATVKAMAPIGISYGDVLIDIEIDENGRMKDYAVVGGQQYLQNEEIRRAIENNLLFTEFNPATTFGQPAPGKIRLSIRSSRIEVKG